MDVPYLLSKAQMRRIDPFSRCRTGSPGSMTDGSVRAIIYVIKHGLMRRAMHPRITGRTRRSTPVHTLELRGGVYDP